MYYTDYAPVGRNPLVPPFNLKSTKETELAMRRDLTTAYPVRGVHTILRKQFYDTLNVTLKKIRLMKQQ